MSEYTHNDDVADMIYEKEQEIAKVQAERDQWRNIAKDLYHHLGQLWVENYDHRYEPKMPCAGCCDVLSAYEKANNGW